MSEPMHIRPRGGMVDTRDLKSLGLVGRAGSSPAAGTTCWVIFYLWHLPIWKVGCETEQKRTLFLDCYTRALKIDARLVTPFLM